MADVWKYFFEERMGGMMEPVQSPHKIRKIAPQPARLDCAGDRVRTTWLGKFYIRYLKRYGLVRWVAHWTWRNGYPVYVGMSARFFGSGAKRWRALSNLSEFATAMKVPTVWLAESTIVVTPEPKVFPACDQSFLKSPDGRYRFPGVFVATVSNALTYGGTNLVIASDTVICHDLYDFARDYTSEELHGRTLISARTKRIRWLLNDEEPESIEVAATFVDACAANYAHWITEVLPRIALFCAEDRFKGIPIVVNDRLHANIMESLFLVAGVEREIILLPVGRALNVNRLYVTSVAGYVPFGKRRRNISGHSHGVFSPFALNVLRSQLATHGENTTGEVLPDKIFLRRTTGVRKVTNSIEIETFLIARGFVVVEPESLSFAQQLQLFKNAKTVISSTGAALANAISCQPGTQLAVLMSKHDDMIYRYWNNLLSPFGIRISYILGKIVDNKGLGIHADFSIDVGYVADLLIDFEREYP